jgi:glutaredoxin 3
MRLFVVIFALVCTCVAAFFPAMHSRSLTTSRIQLSMHIYSSKETAQAHIKASKIMVFSKTHCPYCKKAKEAINQLTPLFSVVELDVVKDGAAQQAALLEMTGQNTVPNIFVNGQHIGGCDKTLAAIASGEFQKLIAAETLV